MTTDTEQFVGSYVTGCGKASRRAQQDDKRREYTRLFGCPMIGTFNVAIPPGKQIGIKPFLESGPDRYWLVRLRRLSPAREAYAYAVRWEGSRQRGDRLELLSKSPIPAVFKEGDPIDVTVYEQWSPERIEEWQAGLGDGTKWQGHAFWQPQRSDSAFVWSHLEQGQDYEGKTVLDIGCNAGYFSFRAAQHGAVVHGTDRNGGILELARTIQHHIEMTDVEFFQMRHPELRLLVNKYDFIFYLSVHHQFDPAYTGLDTMLNALRNNDSTLFLELINPPLAGSLSKGAVDALVRKHGGRELAHYKHRVRCMRSLYELKGEA
jgi:2-polyprenyl-3-methyl-5-hydroxy-6-metoxy-1,4-benzoquinol methylase